MSDNRLARQTGEVQRIEEKREEREGDDEKCLGLVDPWDSTQFIPPVSDLVS
jgi:hypothetical protein